MLKLPDVEEDELRRRRLFLQQQRRVAANRNFQAPGYDVLMIKYFPLLE